jgi:phage protein D
LMYTDIDPRFSVGSPVAIKYEEIDITKGFIPKIGTLVEGEITSIEPVFDGDGRALLRIRGYDRLHRLMRGKKTRAFNMMNDTMLFSMIANESGMMPVPTGLPTKVYENIIQCNQSNWEFLSERAQLFGYQIYADGMKLKAGKADGVRSLLPVDLVWKETLRKFEPRIVSMGQVSTVSALGWDSKTKMGVTMLSAADTSVTKTRIGASIETLKVTGMFGAASDSITEETVQDTGTAKTIAEARFNEMQSQFIQASGELVSGNPYLVAGSLAVIRGVGVRFSGSYYVTEAKHIWRKGKYTVKFDVSGRNPHTIRHMIMGDEPKSGRIEGVVVGVVTNNNDPMMLGRIKVKYPWLPPPIESGWIRMAGPAGGSGRGILFMPEVDDEVLVAFEKGDINSPYIIGGLWNNIDKPPQGTAPAVAGGKVNQRIVRSRSGHIIILDDTQGQEKVIVKDKSGNNSITIDSTLNSIELKAQKDLTIQAGGKLTISCNGELVIETKTKGAISASTGMDVKVQGGTELNLQTAGATLKGIKVDVQATTQASVKGNAMVQIQGGIVTIN